MASTLCPQCNCTIMRGFWEILDKCPNCGADWASDPTATPRMIKRVVLLALLCGLCSFIPTVGFLFGMGALVMGFVAFRMGKRASGITAMVLGVVIGLAGQSVLTYWGYGYLRDRACIGDLTTVATSIRAYKDTTHHFPHSLQDLANAHLPAPTHCPVDGGTYFYMSPEESQAPACTTNPATRPAATTGPSTNPATTAPAATSPATQSASQPDKVPAASQPASQPAPSPGDSKTLMIADLLPDKVHRGGRMCMTSELVVRIVPVNKFDEMLKWPQNTRFAAELDKAYKATGQPANEPASQPATRPSTRPATQPSTRPATQPSTAPASQPARQQQGRPPRRRVSPLGVCLFRPYAA